MPVKYRVQYKVLMCVYKALHNQAPEYIKDMLIPYQSQRHLRSSQNMLLPSRVVETTLFLLRLLHSGMYYRYT